jgi:TonB-dependent receptor
MNASMMTCRSSHVLSLFSLLLALCATTVFGQATGAISGRVFEGATGKSLKGAIVKVLGTTISGTTDADGRYQLAGVPAGTASLEVDYVGLDAFTQSVTVPAGGVATMNAEMKSDVLKMAAFEVAEVARGQALAINQQKTAKGIVNIVSEEVFGAMNEGNIGYALQRLPGITVNESEDGAPSGVNIRGVEGDFNSFTVDGNRVATRGFSTRNLVADGIANIEVIKAMTPDRDGDAIGGTINVISRSAFQRDGREIRLGASTTYLELPEKWGYNGRATYTDLFGILGGEKNLGISITGTKYKSNRYYTNNDTDWLLLNKATNPQYNLPTDVFLMMTNTTNEYNLRSTDAYGINGSIDFRVGPHHSFYFRPLYSHTFISAHKFTTRALVDTRMQDIANGRKTMEFITYERGRGTAGPNGSRGEFRYQLVEEDRTNDLYSFAGGGKHELGSSTITYDLFYSYQHNHRPYDFDFVVRNVPSARGYYQMEYDLAGRIHPKVNIVNGLDPRDLSTVNRSDLSIEPEERWEEAATAKVDWEKKFVGERAATALKFGAKYRSNAPKFSQSEADYRPLVNFPYAQVMTPVDKVIHERQMYMLVDSKKVLDLLRSSPQLYPYLPYESAKGTAEEDFDATEKVTAGYGMFTTQIGRHTILGGVRVEKTSWRSTNKKIDAATLREKTIPTGKNYTQWLPGIHFRHELRKNMILRESYNRSYGRPTLSRLTLGRSVDAVGNIAEGNPNLDPTTSDNFDVQLEQYTANGGLYSAGVFYKKMKGFYYNKVGMFNTLDANDNPIIEAGGLFRYARWENAEGATNKGLELVANQKLFFLPGPLRNLTASTSATFTDSDAKYPDRPNEKLPTFGFSKTMFNGALEYAQGKFRARASYRYRARYLEGLDTSKYIDDWFAAREQVDAEASYRWSKNLRINLSIEDIFGRARSSEQGFLAGAYPEDVYRYGTKFTFGVDFTF